MEMRDRIIMAAPVGIFLGLLITGTIIIPLVRIWALIPIGIAAIWLAVCLRQIPATPPYVGLVTIWGERKPIIKKEGWRLLAPFFPFMFDAILVNVEKKNKDFHPKNVRTKEQAELEIEISITWMPDKKDPQNLIEYINSGGKDGVENILDDIIEEKCREFAIGKDWVSCLKANEEIKLIKRLS